MTFVNTDPIPIDFKNENATFLYNAQLKELLRVAMNLSFTGRTGPIQDSDKAGNFSATYIVFTSNAIANTEDAIPHTLGYKPKGYIPVLQDKAAILYSGPTLFTPTHIYLKSNVTSVTWTVMVF